MAKLEINDMRLGGYPVIIKVTLSERNLLGLLSKLYTPDSEKTIVNNVIDIAGKYADPNMHFAISVESDEQHYAERDAPPGEMHPVTEALVKLLQDSLRVKETPQPPDTTAEDTLTLLGTAIRLLGEMPDHDSNPTQLIPDGWTTECTELTNQASALLLQVQSIMEMRYGRIE